MRKSIFVLILSLALLLVSCELPFSQASTTNIEEQVAQTVAARESATALVAQVEAQVEKKIYDDMTATAEIQKAVADALTAAAPPPTDTLIPSDTPTETPDITVTPSETATLEYTPTETPTETLTPSPTIKASPTSCFTVINDWCLTHQGCSTMRVLNKTQSNAKIRFWIPKGTIDITFYPPPETCSFLIRPGKYNYTFDYCGEHSEGAHALNQNWYIEFKCP